MADINLPTNAYTDADGSVYVQLQPGKDTHYIGGCFEAGDLPNPQGDVEPIWCLDADRNFQSVGGTKSPPSKITSTVTGLTEDSADWLELYTNDFCPFFLHFVEHICGTRGIWAHWERVYTYYVEAITDDPISGFMSREGGNPTTHAFNWTAYPPRVGSRRLGIARKTTTEDTDANCVWVEPKVCGSDCGDEVRLGQHVMVGCDSDTVNPPEVLRSTDFGETWAAVGNRPHAVNENVVAGCAFAIDKDTTRNIALRDGVGGTNMEINYTDDAGLTAWNNVVVGTTAAEGGTTGQCIFAWDQEHIWICTDAGEVYFSDDGGLTWVSQNATGASGGAALNSIDFYDANIGVAVGASTTVILTIDGGENWNAAPAVPGAGTLNTVKMPGPNAQTIVVGDNATDVYHSYDFGETWTSSWATGTDIVSLDAPAPSVYFMADNLAAASDVVRQSADGGNSWQDYTTPTNAGLNQILAPSTTLAYVVGEDQGGSSVIIKLGQGVT